MQPVARELKFCGPRKDPDLKQALRFSKDIANLPWVASELSNPRSLTHAAAAGGIIPFGPALMQAGDVVDYFAGTTKTGLVKEGASKLTDWFSKSKGPSGEKRPLEGGEIPQENAQQARANVR